jgi:hypothetical protein
MVACKKESVNKDSGDNTNSNQTVVSWNMKYVGKYKGTMIHYESLFNWNTGATTITRDTTNDHVITIGYGLTDSTNTADIQKYQYLQYYTDLQEFKFDKDNSYSPPYSSISVKGDSLFFNFSAGLHGGVTTVNFKGKRF